MTADTRGRALTEPGGAVKDSLSVAVWTVVSRVTGLIRGITVAAVLGATFFANTYQFTNSLPNLVFYGFLAGSLFTSLLVPALVRHLDTGDLDSAGKVAGGLLGAVMAASVVLLPVVVLAGPAALRAATVGLGGDPQAADQARVAALLLVLLMPQVLLYSVVGTATAVMNAQRRFALASAAPALENLGTIVLLAGIAVAYHGMPPVHDPPLTFVLVLGLGTTAAVGLHAAAQWWGARRLGVTLWPRWGWRDPEVRALLRHTVRSLAQAGLSALQLLVMLLAADRVAGGVVAFQLALSFFFLPVALGAQPVALSLAPRLARLTSPADEGTFHDTLVQGVRFALFLVVPAAVAFLGLAGPLADAVSHGAFASGSGNALVAAALTGLSLGVVAETLFMIATYAYYARGDTRTPLRAMALQVGLGIPACFLATRLDGASCLAGIGAGLTLSTAAGCAVLWPGLRRRQRQGVRGGERLLPGLQRVILASLVMIVPARLVAPAGIVVAAVTGVVVYAVVHWLVRTPELRLALRAVRLPPSLRVRLAGDRPARAVPADSLERHERGAWASRWDVGDLAPRLGLDALLLLACLAFGVLLAISPKLVGLGAAVALVVLAVVVRPALGAYLVVALTPLTAGIDRGTLLPAVRPNEALLALVAGALVVRGVVRARTGAQRLPRPDAVELSILALCLCSSVVPLLMMLARLREISGDDLTYAIALWKLLAVYLVIRLAVTTRREVTRCLVLSLVVSAVVSALAVLQALKLFGVPELLAPLYSSYGVESALSIGRGSSTLGLPAAFGDFAILNLMLALAMLIQGYRHRLMLIVVAAVCLIGVLSSGEFSTTLALLVALVALVVVTRKVRILAYAVPAALVAAVPLEPVITARLAGFQNASGIPQSWLSRWRNLSTYFWPDLFSQGNWILGVRPAARVPAPSEIFQWVWIESGYTWLLWGGGLPLLAAYIAFVITSTRRGAARARASNLGRPNPVAAAGAVVVAVIAAQVLSMIFDPHLTYRGSGDALFIMLALARLPAAAPVPPRPREAVDNREPALAWKAGPR
jgi:murein biosynthesis integral membrane protein MurJ